MRYYEFAITEALKPSEYRPMVKGWDRERYRDIFTNPKYKHDRKGYRIYIPIEGYSIQIRDEEKTKTYFAIEKFLKDNGFEIVDYIKGIARNIDKNQDMKIGKVLAKLKPTETVMAVTDKGITKSLPLLDAFNVDKVRKGTRSEYMVVISRHPYDIAGMSSDDRGWTSCMNLSNGLNRHYVPLDIKLGSVIAYVTTTDDKDLKNPTGRVLLKPFVDILGKTQIYFGIENAVYGTRVPGFVETVKKWADEVNAAHELDQVAILKQHPDLYRDSDLATHIHVTGRGKSDIEKQQARELYDRPRSILSMENPNDTQLMIAISRKPEVFKIFLDKNPDFKPSESVQRTAVTGSANNIHYILEKNIVPSENTVSIALKGKPMLVHDLLKYGIKLSESNISVLVERYPDSIGYLLNNGYSLSDKQIEAAVRADSDLLLTLYKREMPVSEQIEKTAIDHGFNDIIKIALKYHKQNKKVPDVLVKSFITHHFRQVDKILEWNRDYPELAMDISLKQLKDCVIRDILRPGMNRLSHELIVNHGVEFSNQDVIDIVKDTKNIRILLSLKDAGKLDKSIPPQVLDYNGYAIRFIENPTPSQQLQAVSNRASAIEYIKNPTEEAANTAVKRAPGSLMYIKKPTLNQLILAAKHKMKGVNWRDGESDGLDMNMFFDAMDRASDAGNITEEQENRLLELAVKVEPHRITDIMLIGDRPSEAMQLAAAGVVDDLVGKLLRYHNLPTKKVVMKLIDKGVQAYRILEQLEYYNDHEPEKFEFDEELILYGISKADKEDTYRIMRLLTREINDIFEINQKIANAFLEKDPQLIIYLLASDKVTSDISKDAVMNALKMDAVPDEDEIKRFLGGLVKKNVTPDTDILKALFNSVVNNATEDKKLTTKVIGFLNIQIFCNKNNIPLSESFLKYMIDADKKLIHLMNELDNETKQKIKTYTWKKHEYWQPFLIGDMVRITNPNAKPRYKVSKILDNEYELTREDGTNMRVPRDRILRVNKAEPPK